jgi:trans-aconitate methyltransferase
MTSMTGTVTPEWLSLREPADHAARSRDLVHDAKVNAEDNDLVIHDLGSGTGSMSRWLAPQLAGRQLWVLHDQDEVLLARARSATRPGDVNGRAIGIETRTADVTRLRADDLVGADLVTTSALLDLLTAGEVDRIAHACIDAGCDVLFTLTVTGEVSLSPRHELDETIRSAFNAHQRRTKHGRKLLGPDAVEHAAATLERLGARVEIRPSPWQLGPDDVSLVVEWLTGWVAAACEQQPELTPLAQPYLRDRLAEAAAEQLHVIVGHADVFATPARSNHPHKANV